MLVVTAVALGGAPVDARQTAERPVEQGDDLGAADAALAGATARLVAISPERVLDTRSSSQFSRLGTNESITVAPVTAAVADKAGVAAEDVEAVVVNLTAVDAGDRGWVKVWPAGEPEPDTSSINMGYAGHTIPNLVTMRLGSGQALTIKARAPADIVIDVQAVYVRTASATSGRFQPLTPTRAFDSREGSSIPAGGSVTVDLTTVGVPADASAAVVNVTAARAKARGYYTVYVPGEAVPNASSLNVPGANRNVANQAIARLSNGRLAVFSRGGGDVVVDVIGYMTGPSAPDDSAGLFVPVTPARFIDTRDQAALTDGCIVRVTVAGRADLPATGISAIVANVTATQALGQGNLALTAWNTGNPGVSTVNMLDAGHTVPNHATSLLGDGAVQVRATTGGDVILDVVGYYLGAGGLSGLQTDTGPCQPRLPAYPGAGTQAFLFESFSGSVARWDPCDVLEYWVNVDDAPNQQAIDSMNAAIRTVEEATGIDFVYRGTTSAGTSLDPVDGIDAVIGFSRPERTPALGGSVIGVGGGWFGEREVVYGYAFVDVTDGLGTGRRLQAVFMHEIAHMMGLAHVNDANELMYPFATSRTTFGTGDLEGLYLMGAAQGCLASAALQSEPGGPSLAPPPLYHANVLDHGDHAGHDGAHDGGHSGHAGHDGEQGG